MKAIGKVYDLRNSSPEGEEALISAIEERGFEIEYHNPPGWYNIKDGDGNIVAEMERGMIRTMNSPSLERFLSRLPSIPKTAVSN